MRAIIIILFIFSLFLFFNETTATDQNSKFHNNSNLKFSNFCDSFFFSSLIFSFFVIQQSISLVTPKVAKSQTVKPHSQLSVKINEKFVLY